MERRFNLDPMWLKHGKASIERVPRGRGSGQKKPLETPRKIKRLILEPT
ncbi:MAG: hypothetical protein ABSG74_08805 [Candidatus Bathyarchaeia archaeon]